jgi:hypothetical protein
MPTAPLKPWEPRQPIEAKRLQTWQDRTITDITVGPGLLLLRNGNSASIALAPDGQVIVRPVPAMISELLGGRGVYKAKRGRWTGILNTSADYDFSNVTFSTTADMVVVDDPESTGDAGSHRMAVGQKIEVFPTGIPSDIGLPVYETDFGRPSWKSRYDIPTKSFQQSKNWQDASPTWETYVTLVECSTTGSVAGDFYSY